MFSMWDAYKDAEGETPPYSYLPFVFGAYFVTIGLIYSPSLKLGQYINWTYVASYFVFNSRVIGREFFKVYINAYYGFDNHDCFVINTIYGGLSYYDSKTCFKF